jgi:hypothetical protein
VELERVAPHRATCKSPEEVPARLTSVRSQLFVNDLAALLRNSGVSLGQHVVTAAEILAGVGCRVATSEACLGNLQRN